MLPPLTIIAPPLVPEVHLVIFKLFNSPDSPNQLIAPPLPLVSRLVKLELERVPLSAFQLIAPPEEALPLSNTELPRIFPIPAQ